MVPRNKDSGGEFWEWAERVMDEHAECKDVLQFMFAEEEGYGIGPTLEFYRLLAEEFRRRSLGMWLEGASKEIGSGDGEADDLSSGNFVNPPFGLFPAPYPRDEVPLNVLRRFYIMGITVGKALLVSFVDLH